MEWIRKFWFVKMYVYICIKFVKYVFVYYDLNILLLFVELFEWCIVLCLMFVGECLAVDFEIKMYNESLDVLEYYIKFFRRVFGVVLEQFYFNKMVEGFKLLEMLVYFRSQYLILIYEKRNII